MPGALAAFDLPCAEGDEKDEEERKKNAHADQHGRFSRLADVTLHQQRCPDPDACKTVMRLTDRA